MWASWGCCFVQALCRREGLSFFETSALDATNVDKAFNQILRGIYDNMSKKPMDMYATGPEVRGGAQIDISKPTVAKKRSNCCSQS